MKKILNIALLLLVAAGMTGCNEDEQFEGELYKKIIYLLSDSDKAFQSVHELGEESIGYVSVCVGGTEHIQSDVTIELEHDDEILASYNKINYDIDVDKFAKELAADKYSIPSYTVVMKADSEDNYALMPIHVNPEGLSPDSIYMIPLRIKSVSNYEVNLDKQQVLYQVVLKNEYATMESTTYYQTVGNEVRETSIGTSASGANTTRVIAPLSKNQVRMFVGTHTYNPTNVTREDIDKYAVILTINDDNTISISPYGSIEVEMLGGPEDNYCYIDRLGRHVFHLYYRYKEELVLNDGDKSWTESCWITMDEVSTQSSL